MDRHHLHDWDKIDEPLRFDTVIEDWLGPTLGFLECQLCGSIALAYLIGWQESVRGHRIFAVQQLPTSAYTTYKANIARDYCDLARKGAETDALIGTRFGSVSLVGVNMDSGTISNRTESTCVPVLKPWQSLTLQDYATWQALLLSSA